MSATDARAAAAPAQDLGPALPRNWYLVARAGAVRRGAVIARSFPGREVVVYRDAQGGLVALDGLCRHMGCHLRHAQVTLQGLRCALHHRVIHPDGRLVGGMGETPAVLRQPHFAVVERHGGAFVFLGEGEPPPLPDADAARAGAVEAAYAGEHRFPLPWQALVANGFDAEHLSAVHDRALLSPPALDLGGDGRIRLSYHTRPTGTNIADRFTRWISPDGVRGRISAIGGSMMMVESTVARREAFLILSFQPSPDGATTVRGVVGVEAGRGRARARLQVALARRLFVAFLRKDMRIMEDLRWREPRSLGGIGDAFTRRLCDYFRGLDHAF